MRAVFSIDRAALHNRAAFVLRNDAIALADGAWDRAGVCARTDHAERGTELCARVAKRIPYQSDGRYHTASNDCRGAPVSASAGAGWSRGWADWDCYSDETN